MAARRGRLGRWLGGLAVLGLGLAAGPALAAPHPLDALKADEYRAAVAALRAAGHVDDATRFAQVRLEEPPKAQVLAWQPGQPIPRRAFVVLKQGSEVVEAVVDLVAGSVLSYTPVEGVEPSVLFEEWLAAQAVTTADPGWQEAMRKRGFTEFPEGRFFCAPLTSGYFAIPSLEGKRTLSVQCFDTAGSKTNIYAKPIEGLTAVVDVEARTVVELIDEGIVPMAESSHNYDAESLAPLQPPMKPTLLSQPEGTNIVLDGGMVTWRNWSFHLGFDRRRGTILSLVRFDDGQRPRDVMYQGSLSEVFVPYMDPARGWAYKTYMDAGEYGFGLFATPLQPGIDCPATATYVSHVLALDDGEPVPFDNVVCLFERYAGDPAWRHAEIVNQTFEGRPRTDLVVRMIAAIGNYDYAVDWVLTQSGTIEVDVMATGIDILKGVATKHMSDATAAADTRYGTLVAPNVVAPFHDHFINFRLDLDVDGPQNRFMRSALVPTELPPDNPRRSIWTLRHQHMMTEAEAQLTLSYENPAMWHVESSTATNAVGNPTGYMLMSRGNAISLLLPDDYPQRRAAFAGKHLWVTAYDPKELFAGGEYPNQSKGGDGLPAWSAKNRSIHDADVVLWYTVGFHHVTAAEDLPVLNAHKKSFALMPFNFFDRNPAINLPKADGTQ